MPFLSANRAAIIGVKKDFGLNDEPEENKQEKQPLRHMTISTVNLFTFQSDIAAIYCLYLFEQIIACCAFSVWPSFFFCVLFLFLRKF